MPHARADGAACVLGDMIYVSGGLSSNRVRYRIEDKGRLHVHRYSLKSMYMFQKKENGERPANYRENSLVIQ